MDLALSPVVEEDLDKLALFAETAGGGAALSKRRGEDLARAKLAAVQNVRQRLGYRRIGLERGPEADTRRRRER